MRINLNYDWRYDREWREDMIAVDYDDSGMQSVNIPHTNIELPYNYFDESMYQFVSGYRKRVTLGKELYGKRLILRFEAVASYAKVYVNGSEAMSHKGGYTAFEADITDMVTLDAENVITVMCDSTEREEIPPFGNVIDYLTYGGIYREVYIYVHEPDYIVNAMVAPIDVLTDSPQLDIKVTLSKPCSGAIRAVLSKDGDVIATGEITGEGTDIHGLLAVDRAKIELWDTEHPILYDVTLEYGEESYSCRTGFREARFTKDGFLLNGKELKIRGLNRHQAYPYVGYAMPASAQIDDADYLKKELGVNLVRTSHYPNSHHFLDRCDEIGLLVFTEIPGWQYVSRDNEEWRDNVVTNVWEMIEQDYNHVSIIIWGVRINESDDDHELYTRTNALAHELDKTRQTGGVRCFPQSELLEDVYTYNDFTWNNNRQGLLPKIVVTGLDKPLLITEHNGHMYPTKTFDHEKKRQKHALNHAKVLNKAYKRKGTCGAIGWCMSDYNTHKDFGSGDRICYHGVSDMFRMDKLAAGVYRSQQDEYPYIELTSNMEIGDNAGGEVGSVYIFTNCDAVNLYKNGMHINTFNIRELARKSPWKHLPHPPVELYDIIGNQLDDTYIKPRDRKAVKRFLLDIKKYGHIKSIAKHIFIVIKLLLVYRKSIADVTSLYGRFVTGWGAKACSYRLEGLKGDKTVSVNKEIATGLTLNVEADRDAMCEGETYDVCRVTMRATTQSGSSVPYANNVMNISVTGAAELIGDSAVALIGGQRAFWIKTIGQSGKATVTVKSDIGSKTIELDVTKVPVQA